MDDIGLVIGVSFFVIGGVIWDALLGRKPCVECGTKVGARTKRCPNCHKNPHKVKCVLCAEWMKQSEGTRFGHLGGSANDAGFVHEACFAIWREKIQSQTFRCKDCRKTFRYGDAQAHVVTDNTDKKYPIHEFHCPECGKSTKIESCANCGLPLVPDQEKTVILPPPDEAGEARTWKVHKACKSMANARIGKGLGQFAFWRKYV